MTCVKANKITFELIDFHKNVCIYVEILYELSSSFTYSLFCIISFRGEGSGERVLLRCKRAKSINQRPTLILMGAFWRCCVPQMQKCVLPRRGPNTFSYQWRPQTHTDSPPYHHMSRRSGAHGPETKLDTPSLFTHTFRHGHRLVSSLYCLVSLKHLRLFLYSPTAHAVVLWRCVFAFLSARWKDWQHTSDNTRSRSLVSLLVSI